MDDKRLLADLEKMHAENKSLVAFHRGEAAKYEEQANRYAAAIAALRGGSKPTQSRTPSRAGKKSGPTSTMTVLRDVLNRSMVPRSPTELTEDMLASGWETISENPVNTVRTALLRLSEKGEIARLGDGRYTRLTIPVWHEDDRPSD